mgnify:CR=1 FL=1
MDKYKKFMYIGIFILLISLVSSAGTYAWFTWISPSNTSVTLSIGNLADVTFTSGPDINISNLAPVYNYTDGVSTTFTVRNTNSTDSLLYKVKLEITSIANELKDESFKYTLLKDNKVIKTGNLKDAVNGNPLILNTSSLDKGSTSSPKTSTFKLYFWLDGNMENNSNMMNKSLVGKIDVGVETNVIVSDNSTPSSEDSTFLNTSIARKNIKTLKYVDNLNIPEGATVVDVSKNGDNTIKMWYNEADANGNYDITIGSNNIIYANPSGSNLFSNLTNVTSIDLSNLDTSGIAGMNGMFENDKVLTNIVFGDNFNTSNATNMTAMFRGCNNLTELDLRMFDTSNVRNMGNMFLNCTKLESLDLSMFDTSNVMDMGGMFLNCTKLESLDLSSFDTSSITNFGKIFYHCTSLKSLNVSNFNTSNVTNFYDMFNGCSSLKELDVSGFDTSKAVIMGNMFSGCSSLESLDVSHFNTSNVKTMSNMFSSLKCSLDLSNFDTSNVDNLSQMFMYYKNERLDLSSFDTSKVTSTNHMFASSSIEYIDLRNADFSNVTDYTNMFKGISKSTIIYLKDTTGNRNFMNTNFNNITATYIS